MLHAWDETDEPTDRRSLREVLEELPRFLCWLFGRGEPRGR